MQNVEGWGAEERRGETGTTAGWQGIRCYLCYYTTLVSVRQPKDLNRPPVKSCTSNKVSFQSPKSSFFSQPPPPDMRPRSTSPDAEVNKLCGTAADPSVGSECRRASEMVAPETAAPEELLHISSSKQGQTVYLTFPVPGTNPGLRVRLPRFLGGRGGADTAPDDGGGLAPRMVPYVSLLTRLGT